MVEETLGLLEWVGAVVEEVDVLRARPSFDPAIIGVKTVPFDGGARGRDPEEECPENCEDPGAEVESGPS